MSAEPSAATVVEALERAHDPAELATVRKRVAADEPAIGVRMGRLFEIAKANAALPISVVHELLDEHAYEPRLAAWCILDFKARRALGGGERQELYDVYRRRHDRITTWDMVDRAAPRVVGGYLAGRSSAPLFDFADAADSLRRRTAITAPLWFVRHGSDADVAVGWQVAARLADDQESVVSNAVGIFAKHAGARDGAELERFLTAHAADLARPALRLAVAKLPADERRRWVGR